MRIPVCETGACESARQLLAKSIAANPRDARMRSSHAMALACIGRKEKAVREARLAADITPISSDALDGPKYMEALAEVYTMVGEYDAALDLLDRLLAMPHYDALLFVSFGGPERPEDIMPFLENVTRGRGVPRERLLLGGRSPINEQNRALIAALRTEFDRHGLALPIHFGNRNWAPYLKDAVAEMKEAGVKRALAFITSAYSSYSGCRQYLDDIERARAAVDGAPVIEPLRRFFNHPGFVEACVDRVRTAWDELGAALGPGSRAGARIVFTAHSIPRAMAATCDYELQLRATAALIAARLGDAPWDLVWQSRSGPPQVPWLEPDILDHLRALRARGVPGLVIAPIGFLSDHVEVLYDLDEEARLLCEEIGLPMMRAGTVGTHPRFVEAIRELVVERLRGEAPRTLGPLPPRPDRCAPGCCPAPPRAPLSAPPGRTPAGPA